ncbi:hypothetical protein DelCs14_3879 [Delftia sp. Cs1-4]|uniref:hypothetical protein n=1 Tax=Delftia sp. (strain Cs1-4) TaxID=742013 RepID=UPI00020E8152|nr:hypothetical protein [Delftia sp. Cs1-4]AEF90866.1 hypothetical protein DelCs14_3879 [Delftia sp. Cs1-4]
MIGTQPTGTIEGVQISAVSHEGLSVSINGKPGRLAVITEDGQIIATGKDVAREAAAVSINCYRNFLKGQGFLRILSNPLKVD